MTQHFAVKLQFCSGIGSNLTTRSLFGQVAWAIQDLWGVSKLEELLSCLDREPALVISSPRPSGYLPWPSLSRRVVEIAVNMTTAAAGAQKFFNRARFAPSNWYKGSLQDLLKHASENPGALLSNAFDAMDSVHNVVNRQSGMSEDIFVKPRLYPKSELENYSLDFEIGGSFFRESDLKEILEYLTTVGLGADRNTGFGHCRLTSFKATNFQHCDNGVAILLGDILPCVDDLDYQDGSWRTLTRPGRSGDGAVLPRLITIEFGSTFLGKAKRSIFGSCKRYEVKGQNRLQYGYAPSISLPLGSIAWE